MTDDLVLRPSGDLDVGTARAALDRWRRTVETRRPAQVVVDLSAVTFIDSSGLSALIGLRKTMTEQGGSCLLRGASLQQMKVLRMTGLTAAFPDADLPADP